MLRCCRSRSGAPRAAVCRFMTSCTSWTPRGGANGSCPRCACLPAHCDLATASIDGPRASQRTGACASSCTCNSRFAWFGSTESTACSACLVEMVPVVCNARWLWRTTNYTSSTAITSARALDAMQRQMLRLKQCSRWQQHLTFCEQHHMSASAQLRAGKGCARLRAENAGKVANCDTGLSTSA